MEPDLPEATRMLQDEYAREKIASEEESAELNAQLEEMKAQLEELYKQIQTIPDCNIPDCKLGISQMDRPSSSNEIVTVVLVGNFRNGKSATGNTIMGKRTFKSEARAYNVTKTAELRTSNLIPDQTIDVIDTPGLVVYPGCEAIGEEIVKCIDLAKKGIHAVLIVLSVRNRFSEEEEAAIYFLQYLFGSKIFDYAIVVFTGGDDLDDENMSLDDWLSDQCTNYLKGLLQLCGDRKVLFDNRTKDKSRQSEQVQKLLSLVYQVRTVNGREPYTHKHLGKDGNMKLSIPTAFMKEGIPTVRSCIPTAYYETLQQISEEYYSEEQKAQVQERPKEPYQIQGKLGISQMDRPSSSNEIVTVVLVGKTGNGKSATGNSIMGRKTFKSKTSACSVTKTTELLTSNFIPDQTIDVIDTPGLAVYTGCEAIGEEIVKCIDLAKNGIHAVLIVLSARARFSEKEEAAIYCLQNLFGSKIFDYAIVVFTSGDSLDEDNESLDDLLSDHSTNYLKEILQLCGDRKVLFDNRTKDKSRQSQQVQKLLSLVYQVRTVNGREPYTHRHFGMDGNMKLSIPTAFMKEGIPTAFMRSCIPTAYYETLQQISEEYYGEKQKAQVHERPEEPCQTIKQLEILSVVLDNVGAIVQTAMVIASCNIL